MYNRLMDNIDHLWTNKMLLVEAHYKQSRQVICASFHYLFSCCCCCFGSVQALDHIGTDGRHNLEEFISRNVSETACVSACIDACVYTNIMPTHVVGTKRQGFIP